MCYHHLLLASRPRKLKSLQLGASPEQARLNFYLGAKDCLNAFTYCERHSNVVVKGAKDSLNAFTQAEDTIT